jgi:hypothetical protein
MDWEDETENVSADEYALITEEECGRANNSAVTD